MTLNFKSQNNKSNQLLTAILIILTQLSSCAFAPWDQSTTKSDTAEEKVNAAQKSFDKKPEATVARKNLLVSKELAVTELSKLAEQAKDKGNYQEADQFYNRILSFLPDDAMALKGKAAVLKAVSQAAKVDKLSESAEEVNIEKTKQAVREVLLENPQQSQAIQLNQQLNEQSPPVKVLPPTLKPSSDKPVTLELRDANIKVVFEALSRATGINFILDKDIKPDTKATIFVKKARIEDAIDMVLSSNGLQKKALSENTALVFPATKQKLSDYQDLMIRSFYLTNTSAKQVAALLKTMLKTKDIFVDDRLNMLVMRDTPEVIHLAEKLVAANDLEDP